MDKTTENLWKAFAGESQARNKYTFFASVAKREGYEQIADIFLETADNEKEHAKIIFSFLKELGDTKANLTAAAGGEHDEWTSMYPEFARIAREEGHEAVAEFFSRVAEVERAHEARYKALLENVESSRVFNRESSVKWHCRNCGYVYEGTDAPEFCPACSHPKAFYEVLAENY